MVKVHGRCRFPLGAPKQEALFVAPARTKIRPGGVQCSSHLPEIGDEDGTLAERSGLTGRTKTSLPDTCNRKTERAVNRTGMMQNGKTGRDDHCSLGVPFLWGITANAAPVVMDPA